MVKSTYPVIHIVTISSNFFIEVTKPLGFLTSA